MPVINEKFGTLTTLQVKSNIVLTALLIVPADIEALYTSVITPLYVSDKILHIHSVTEPVMIGLFTSISVFFSYSDFN